jgi:hypothetical protein
MNVPIIAITFLGIQIDDVDTVFAQPIDPAPKVYRFPDDHFSDIELPYQPAAVPARSKGGDHYRAAIRALPSGISKRVGLTVYRGIVLLNALVMAAAEQISVPVEESRTDGNAAFAKTFAGFVQRHREPCIRVKLLIHHPGIV